MALHGTAVCIVAAVFSALQPWTEEHPTTNLTDIHQHCRDRYTALQPQVRGSSLLLLLLLLGEVQFRRLLLFVGCCIWQADQLLRSPAKTRKKGTRTERR